ncbi:hypothetical protein AAY473_005703 [Plecturocebus cupreus]
MRGSRQPPGIGPQAFTPVVGRHLIDFPCTFPGVPSRAFALGVGRHLNEGLVLPHPKAYPCQRNRNLKTDCKTTFCAAHFKNHDFSLLAKPLCEAMKGGKEEPLLLETEQAMAFKEIKRALIQAPALGFPDQTKLFLLHINKRKGNSCGSPNANVWVTALACSISFQTIGFCWPCGFKAVMSTALLVQEAGKLTLGQKLIIQVSHTIIILLDQNRTPLAKPRMTRYQGLLCDNPNIVVETVNTLNPAMLLPIEEPEIPPANCCIDMVDEVFSSQKDLTDQSFHDSDVDYFTDGGSFISEGIRQAGFAIVTYDFGPSGGSVIQAWPLPVGTSAQEAELIA